jgi:hypothetical protein
MTNQEREKFNHFFKIQEQEAFIVYTVQLAQKQLELLGSEVKIQIILPDGNVYPEKS